MEFQLLENSVLTWSPLTPSMHWATLLLSITVSKHLSKSFQDKNFEQAFECWGTVQDRVIAPCLINVHQLCNCIAVRKCEYFVGKYYGHLWWYYLKSLLWPIHPCLLFIHQQGIPGHEKGFSHQTKRHNQRLPCSRTLCSEGSMSFSISSSRGPSGLSPPSNLAIFSASLFATNSFSLISCSCSSFS